MFLLGIKRGILKQFHREENLSKSVGIGSAGSVFFNLIFSLVRILKIAYEVNILKNIFTLCCGRGGKEVICLLLALLLQKIDSAGR